MSGRELTTWVVIGSLVLQLGGISSFDSNRAHAAAKPVASEGTTSAEGVSFGGEFKDQQGRQNKYKVEITTYTSGDKAAEEALRKDTAELAKAATSGKVDTIIMLPPSGADTNQVIQDTEDAAVKMGVDPKQAQKVELTDAEIKTSRGLFGYTTKRDVQRAVIRWTISGGITVVSMLLTGYPLPISLFMGAAVMGPASASFSLFRQHYENFLNVNVADYLIKKIKGDKSEVKSASMLGKLNKFFWTEKLFLGLFLFGLSVSGFQSPDTALHIIISLAKNAALTTGSQGIWDAVLSRLVADKRNELIVKYGLDPLNPEHQEVTKLNNRFGNMFLLVSAVSVFSGIMLTIGDQKEMLVATIIGNVLMYTLSATGILKYITTNKDKISTYLKNKFRGVELNKLADEPVGMNSCAGLF